MPNVLALTRVRKPAKPAVARRCWTPG